MTRAIQFISLLLLVGMVAVSCDSMTGSNSNIINNSGVLSSVSSDQADVNSTVVVSGDTFEPSEYSGWLFNRDLNTQSPFIFTTDQTSIGNGSLYVEPISNTINDNNDKFIGELFLDEAIAGIGSISYDFLIGSGGDETDANEFYLNIYANFGDSEFDKYYDCKYDLVPQSGSTMNWTTVTFDPTQSYPVTQRDDSPYTCPDVPADMDNLSEGSTIRMAAINVGDTSGNDQGLDGYYDNVVVTKGEDVITYDFEPFVRTAEILTPLAGETVSGVVDFTATLNDQEGNDDVQWAVRAETCAAGSGALYGNTAGNDDSFNWDGTTFSASIDMSSDTPGNYCFVFNPTEDSDDADVRLTREFVLEMLSPETKNDCKKGGWQEFGFKNQGQCIRYVNTGKDSR